MLKVVLYITIYIPNEKEKLLMRYPDFPCFSPSGELRARVDLSRARLSDDIYAYPKSYNDGNGWPGDWPGRALLGQILIARAGGEAPSSLEGNLAHLGELFNERGYAGPVSDLPDEQQLSGNSWLLRALCELYEWKREPDVLERIRAMVRGLYLPLEGKYRVYPRTKDSRLLGTGAESGQTTGEIVNGWILSSDIGCSFIPLDGMTHVYRLTRDPALGRVIREAIEAFADSDLLAATFQTHATLSAVRGILRFWQDVGGAELLDLARRVFAFYEREGMTENYANKNWFGRPAWTEPCAIADSFLAAMQLYAATGDAHYLGLAESIHFNAFSFAQRANGGFGCDCCAGERLHPSSEGSYEASWCCTMRGGEGLARAVQYAAGIEDNGVVCLNLLFPGSYDVGGLKLDVQTRYPYEGLVSVRIREAAEGASLRVRAPFPVAQSEGFRQEGGFLYSASPLEAGAELFFRMTLPARLVPSLFTAGKHTVRLGNLMYALDPASLENGADALRAADIEGLRPVLGGSRLTDDAGHSFIPLTRSTFTSREDILRTDWQLLF